MERFCFKFYFCLKLRAMKKLLVGIFTVISFSMNAQVQTPALSPVSKFEQKVGLTDITIQYSRPGKRDRLVLETLSLLVKYGD